MVILGTMETRSLYLVTSTVLTVVIETVLMIPAEEDDVRMMMTCYMLFLWCARA